MGHVKPINMSFSEGGEVKPGCFLPETQKKTKIFSGYYRPPLLTGVWGHLQNQVGGDSQHINTPNH